MLTVQESRDGSLELGRGCLDLIGAGFDLGAQLLVASVLGDLAKNGGGFSSLTNLLIGHHPISLCSGHCRARECQSNFRR
jgi:hypothetical protein